jgi:hypothetical protein
MMPRDILSEYGKDSGAPQVARATSGGRQTPRDVMNYAAPKGPTNINDPKSPGIHGDGHGMARCPTAGRGSGHAGIGGTNHGNKGSQRG